jgi:hypothetical protein
MRIVNDNRDPGAVATNYTQLVSQDHVNFTFGPSSSLLTAPAQVAARYHTRSPRARAVRRRFDLTTAQPVRGQRAGRRSTGAVRHWVGSLPASWRPETAACPMVSDPFGPMARTAQKIIQGAGVQTVYSKIFPAGNPDDKAGAYQVASLKPQLVVIGAVDVPTGSSFVNAFKQQHVSPKVLPAGATGSVAIVNPQPAGATADLRTQGRNGLCAAPASRPYEPRPSPSWPPPAWPPAASAPLTPRAPPAAADPAAPP